MSTMSTQRRARHWPSAHARLGPGSSCVITTASPGLGMDGHPSRDPGGRNPLPPPSPFRNVLWLAVPVMHPKRFLDRQGPQGLRVGRSVGA